VYEIYELIRQAVMECIGLDVSGEVPAKEMLSRSGWANKPTRIGDGRGQLEEEHSFGLRPPGQEEKIPRKTTCLKPLPSRCKRDKKARQEAP
jgi:hypothetical protein